MKSFPFLRTGLTRTESPKQIKEEADKIELPLFLIMNGVPELMVENATLDQLSVLEECVIRKKASDKRVSDSYVTQIGVVRALGGDKSK